MTLFEYYIIFCVATGIMSVLDLYWPIVSKAKKEGIINELTESPSVGIFIFFFFNMILAPFIFVVIIIPALNAKAAKGLDASIRESKNQS